MCECTQVQSGIDTNDDRQLESSEATATAYVCIGDTGAQGAPGVEGPQGVRVTPALLDRRVLQGPRDCKATPVPRA